MFHSKLIVLGPKYNPDLFFPLNANSEFLEPGMWLFGFSNLKGIASKINKAACLLGVLPMFQKVESVETNIWVVQVFFVVDQSSQITWTWMNLVLFFLLLSHFISLVYRLLCAHTPFWSSANDQIYARLYSCWNFCRTTKR